MNRALERLRQVVGRWPAISAMVLVIAAVWLAKLVYPSEPGWWVDRGLDVVGIAVGVLAHRALLPDR